MVGRPGKKPLGGDAMTLQDINTQEAQPQHHHHEEPALADLKRKVEEVLSTGHRAHVSGHRADQHTFMFILSQGDDLDGQLATLWLQEPKDFDVTPVSY